MSWKCQDCGTDCTTATEDMSLGPICESCAWYLAKCALGLRWALKNNERLPTERSALLEWFRPYKEKP